MQIFSWCAVPSFGQTVDLVEENGEYECTFFSSVGTCRCFDAYDTYVMGDDVFMKRNLCCLLRAVRTVFAGN